ncbi:MAG: hypothetical protein ACFFCI_14410 [Promethearchaeota archaeon]
MSDFSEIPGFSKYFRVVSPSEIAIDKEEIFYREKYNELINYIKTMVLYSEDTILNEYVSPIGSVLININPGTDILEYIKLISMNYSLDFIEIRLTEIRSSPEKFLKELDSIVETFKKNSSKVGGYSEKEIEEEDDSIQSEEKIERKILLFNQHRELKQILEDINLLDYIFGAQNDRHLNFLDSNLLLIWINYEMQDIINLSSNIYDSFDLFLKIPLLNKIERETVFRDFLEKHPKIVFDINAIVNNTENWEVNDIKQLMKVGIFKQFLNSELNDTSNEITHILLELIESGEFFPYNLSRIPNDNQIVEESEKNQYNNKQISNIKEDEISKTPQVNDYIDQIRQSRTSDFMLEQLYENAAFSNYNELLLIIDKLIRNEPLHDNDRKLLAKYSFILNDPPNRAQINLEKAKKKVDRMTQAFGK